MVAEGGDDARLRPAAAGVGAGAGSKAVVRTGGGKRLDPVVIKRVRNRAAVQRCTAEHILILRGPDAVPLCLRAGVVHVRERGAAGEHAGADVGDPVLDRHALQTRAAVKQAVGQLLETRAEHGVGHARTICERVVVEQGKLVKRQCLKCVAAGKSV